MNTMNTMMGRCADCRFWVKPELSNTMPASRPGRWQACEVTRRKDGLFYFEVVGYEDSGEILTRSNFGCIQWETSSYSHQPHTDTGT